MKDGHWYGLLLSTGAASTAAEIAGLRLLAPLFGSSLPIWGTAIAIVIGGLAVGYALGGKKSERNTTETTVAQHAALGAALFLTLPILFAAAAWLRSQFLATSSPVMFTLSLLIAFLSLLPPTITFGMVSPLAIQVEASRRRQSTGHTAGRIFMLTTIGSLIGIVAPSFLTIPFLGTRETVWLFAGLVLVLTLPMLLAPARQHTPLLSLIAAAAASSLIPRAVEPNEIFAAETAYQHVIVRQQDNQRLLIFDAGLGVQSRWTPDLYTNAYWDYSAALPVFIPPQDTVDVLILGSAASSTELQMTKLWPAEQQFDFTSVEIDSALAGIAEQFFDPPIRHTVTADARRFAAADTNTYDIILLDTYAREATIPAHLATREFFSQLSPRLANNGILAVNLNALSPDSRLIQSFARTMQSVYLHTKLMSVPDSCNYLLLASDQPINPPTEAPPNIVPLLPALQSLAAPTTENGVLLTDNRAPTDWLGLMAFMTRSNTDASCASEESSEVQAQ